MRNLTELLQEIPLDEMMGGLNVMKNTAENNERTVEQTNGNARIKSKAPAFAACAACAAIIAVSAVQFSHNNFEPSAADENTGITTDAEDITKEDGESEEEVLDMEIYETSVDENEINYMMSRLSYDNFGRDYELAKDNIRLMDGKVGEIEEGFENLDIRVADVRVCYPYYLIDIAVQSKDGSVISDYSFINVNGDIRVNGKDVDWHCDYLNIYGDKATATYRLDLTKDNCRELNENSDSDVEVAIYSFRDHSAEHDGLVTIAEGEFRAQFKAGEILTNCPREAWGPDAEYAWAVSGNQRRSHWDMMYRGEQRDLDFTINAIIGSNCGLVLNMSVENGDEDMTNQEFNECLDPFWREMLMYYSPDEIAKSREDVIDDGDYFYPARDYNFVKLLYKDGTVADLDFDCLISQKNDDDTYTLYFNNLSKPYDIDKLEAYIIGDSKIGAYIGETDYRN